MKKHKFKDFLGETRVRITSFIKRNKYITLGILLFAIIGIIVGFVVFADDNDEIHASSITMSDNVTITGLENYEGTDIAKSFSDVTFKINYDLKFNNSTEGNDFLSVPLVAKASIPNNSIDAYWLNDNENYDYLYGNESNEDELNKSTVSVKFKQYLDNCNYSSVSGSYTCSFEITLRLGNIKGEITEAENGELSFETSVTPTFTVEDSPADTDSTPSAADTKTLDNIPVVSEEEVTLEHFLIAGNPYKKDENSRYMPFGIILGLKCNNDNDCTNLKGKYIKPNYTLTLTANNDGSNPPQLSFVSDLDPELNKIGLYDRSSNYILDVNMPNSTNNPDSLSVFNSGEVSVSGGATNKIIQINNIKFSLDNNPIISAHGKDGTSNVVAFGSYYATYISERSTDNDVKTWANVHKDDTINNAVAISMTNYKDQQGTSTLDIKLENEDQTRAVLAYEEEIGMVVTYKYGLDSDNETLSNLKIKVPISPEGDISKLNKISYDVGSTALAKIERTNSNGDVEEFNDKFNYLDLTDSELNSKTLEFKLKDGVSINKGDTIIFYIRMKSNYKDGKSEISITPEAYIGENKIETLRENETVNLILTPFKVRSKIYYLDTTTTEDSDLQEEIETTNSTININSSKSHSTFLIYPTIVAPSVLENSNALGISKINTITVEVNLPQYISFIKNTSDSSYLAPSSISASSKKITYKLQNYKFGDYISPIKFDFGYDVDIPNGQSHEIKVVVSAEADNNAEDVSDEIDRTATTTVKYDWISNNDIALSMTSSSTTVQKNDEFTVSTLLYNRTEEQKGPYDIIVTMPEGLEKGDIIDISSGTEDEEVKCSNETSIASAMQWSDCSQINDIRLIKVSNIKMAGKSKEVIDIKVKVNPNYEFKKYDFKVDLNADDTALSSSVSVNIETSTISGSVWLDFNKDGIKDSDEIGIDGIVLNLYKGEVGNSQLVDTKSTVDGLYSFDVGDEDATYYIVPEFDSNRYGLTQHHGEITDIRDRSSFKLYGSDEQESQSSETDADLINEDEENEETSVQLSSENIRSDLIEISDEKRKISNINLGLTLKEVFKVKINKFITSAITTSNLGISNTTNFGNVSYAKLDVKNINSMSIKVIYTIKIKNVGYYPGYVQKITDIIPYGMVFNENYPENRGWSKTDDSNLVIEYKGIKDLELYENQEEYITVAFDLVNKTEGDYYNTVTINDEDLKLYDKSIYKEQEDK